MDQEIVDILNKVPRCVTRKVIKINSSLDFFNVNHPSLGPNHTRKVDKPMINRQEMTREQFDEEFKKGNIFDSQKNKDESDYDFLIRQLEEIDSYTNSDFSFDEVEVKVLLENKDWEGLNSLLVEASNQQDHLNVMLNDYYDFIEAKEKNKIIF